MTYSEQAAHEVHEVKEEFIQTVSTWDFAVRAFKIFGLTLFYYCFSISLTFYNKKFIHAFEFPLSITMTHLVIKFVLSAITRTVLECVQKRPRIVLTWTEYVKRVAPPGIASSLDIGLSNWSFEYISISLYTMTKSTVILFIMAFALILRLEKPRWSLLIVVPLISSGLFLFTYESTDFNLFGFLLVLSASFLSGLRWTLAQLVLQKNEIGLSNPIDMMYHIQPWMILTMLPLSAAFEGLHVSTSKDTFGFKDTKLLSEHLGILLLGAFVAFGLELSEFLLVLNTSSLTLSVSGIIKEVVTLVLAAVITHDPIHWLNGLGLAVCLSGILAHVIFKIVYTSPVHHEKEHENTDPQAIALLPMNNKDDEESSEDEIFINNYSG